MKKAALIFGVFNPVTLAHIELGEVSKKTVPDADIWYIPANARFVLDKMQGKVFLSEKERLRLLKESLPDNFRISDVEITGRVNGKTYNTVEYFKRVLKYDEVYICMGDDNLENLWQWVCAEELVSENKFLVFERTRGDIRDYIDDIRLISDYKDNFKGIAYTTLCKHISSTQVRKAYEENLQDIKYYIPDPVYKYLLMKKERPYV